MLLRTTLRGLTRTMTILPMNLGPKPVSMVLSTPVQSVRMKSNNKKSDKKGKKRIDNLVDDLIDSDGEDEADKNKKLVDDEDYLTNVTLANTPAAKFIQKMNKGGGGKKKPLKGGKSGKTVVPATYPEVAQLIPIDKAWAEFNVEVEKLKAHFINHMTLRSLNALDNLPIHLEGDEYPLHEIATLSKKDPKKLIIDCSSFPQATADIVKAIQASGMNLNPQQEGIRIFVPIPKVTKEYREKLAKGVKTVLNSCKTDIKRIYGKYDAALVDLEQGADASVDQILGSKETLKIVMDHFLKEAEDLAQVKEQELLKA